jgi:flagellar protein FlaG
MIIQNTPHLSQAAQPELRVGDAAPKLVVQTSVQAPQQPSPQQLKQAVDNINRAVQPSNNNLEFSIDPDTQKVVVKMVDTETGDVIRQFPSEETLAIAESIDQYQKGLLLSQKA